MKKYTLTHPYNQKVFGEFSYASEPEVEKAIDLLQAGRKTQKALAPFQRADILAKLTQLLKDKHEELAQTIVLETGKTLKDARIEMTRAIATIQCSSEEARRLTGETLSSDAFAPARNKIGVVQWEPLGVVLAITPFNFPINIAAHKIGPAFASGNTVFFKPHPYNPLSSKLFVDLCYEAGVPKDTLLCCLPDIAELKGALASEKIQCINFTGGVAAGKAIASTCGMKKLIFELGGNDPLIVMPDADLSLAAQTAIQQRFITAGQRCTGAKRLFVHNKVHKDFCHILLSKAQELVVGDPSLPATDVGPVINAAAANTVKEAIDDALLKGAKLLFGGDVFLEKSLVNPTIIDQLTDHALLAHKEVFGPVIPLRPFEDIEEIIPLINNSKYGLQAGVFTQSLELTKDLFQKLEVGLLAINDGPGFRAEHFPFGGFKDSGLGREGVPYAMREMCTQKTLVF